MNSPEKKRNYSRKREAILKAVRSTADWVYQTLKPKFPDLSLGTVYRNLTQLRRDGAIISIGDVNGQERYDGNVRPHTHFVCSRCHSVLDIPGDFVDKEQTKSAAEKLGLEVYSCDLLLHGICDKCLQEQKNEANE
mgnify:FL=1